ncbi:hypothetical protein [Roseomonas sp. WA12]
MSLGAANDCTLKIGEDISANPGLKKTDFQITLQSPAAALKLNLGCAACRVSRGRFLRPMLLLQDGHDPSGRIAVTQQAVQDAHAADAAADACVHPGKVQHSVVAASSHADVTTDASE